MSANSTLGAGIPKQCCVQLMPSRLDLETCIHHLEQVGQCLRLGDVAMTMLQHPQTPKQRALGPRLRQVQQARSQVEKTLTILKTLTR